MISPADMRTPPHEFVGVVKLVNCYAATHVQGNKKSFVSKHPEEDITIAQATAKLFAQTHHIAYTDTLLKLNQPIMTVLKYGENWFPAELHSDNLSVLTAFGPLQLEGSQENATRMANLIAFARRQDCIPSIGISLSN